MRTTVEQEVHHYELDTGARAVIKQRTTLPLVTIAIAARGGLHDEAPSHAGLTGLMARASLKGTPTRTATDIAIAAETMGGSISPSVTADLFDWSITVPARHFERAVDLLSDVAFNASFPEAEFEIERKLALADVQQSRDDMYRYPLRLCMQEAFRTHPYGNTIAAVEAALQRATRRDVAAWHTLRIRQEPWFFVVGDVDPDAAMRVIEAVAPQAAVDAPNRGEPVVWQGSARTVELREKAQTALALAFPGPARDSFDADVLQVLANAVGGLGGRFFEELRSKRSLAYTVALLPVSRWLGGAFISYIATSPEREAEAREALLEQFQRLVEEPLPAAEVERSQRYTIGTWQIRSQTNAAQLGDLLQAYLLGGGVAEIIEFEERVRAVTPEEILRAARSYFDPALLVEGIVRGKETSA